MNSNAGAHAREPSLIERLASHAHAIRIDSMPREARAQAALCILDTIGCAVAGSALPQARDLVRCEAGRDGRAESTALAHGVRVSVEAATRINGYMGDLLELNDLIGGHASIGIVPPALALAEARGASGATLIEAVVAGIEVTARVYHAYYPTLKPFTEVGMSAVGFPSTLGAAAAVARLMGLDEAATAHAIANAGALANWCPAEVIFGEGGSIKPMLFGACPGTAALAGAQYASAGFTGPLRLLEGHMGFFATACRGADTTPILDRETWHVTRPRRKLHACCGYIHAAIDALVAMRHEGVDLSRAARIEVRMPGYVIPAVSKAEPPGSVTEALFHAQYCLALAACGHDVIEPAHAIESPALARRPDVAAQMARMHVEADPALTHYHQSRVSIVAPSGDVVASREVRAPKGTAGNPLTDSEVRDKFARLAGGRLEGMPMHAYLERVDALEREPRLDWLVGAFDSA